MNRPAFVFTVIMLVLAANLCLAEIPKLINYQGMLTESDGTTPVADDQYDLGFKIYGSQSGDDSLWWEYHLNVQVTNGLFNVILGSQSALNLSFDAEYWLETIVETEIMPTRLQFTSVSYAYRAKVADSAAVAGSGASSGGWVDDGTVIRLESTTDSVGIGTEYPGAKLNVVGGGLLINTAQVGGYYSRIEGNEIIGGLIGPPGLHHLHIKPGDNSSYLLLAEDGGNVGIGTDTPTEKLHIVGGGLLINTAQVGGYYTRIEGNEIMGGLIGPPGTHHLHIKPGDNSSHLLLAEDGGNVGIGTDNPLTKLHIVGGAFWVLTSEIGGNGCRITGNEIAGTGVNPPGSNPLHVKPGDNSSSVLLAEDGGQVGIGTANPQGALDVSSTTGGLIVPRLTTTQRDALTAVNGMIIYNTTTNQFNFYENGAWVTK
jgi:hypothetical protein